MLNIIDPAQTPHILLPALRTPLQPTDQCWQNFQSFQRQEPATAARVAQVHRTTLNITNSRAQPRSACAFCDKPGQYPYQLFCKWKFSVALKYILIGVTKMLVLKEVKSSAGCLHLGTTRMEGDSEFQKLLTIPGTRLTFQRRGGTVSITNNLKYPQEHSALPSSTVPSVPSPISVEQLLKASAPILRVLLQSESRML